MYLTGWGRYPRIQAQGYSFEDTAHLAQVLKEEGDFIVYALGRSYGDSALNHKVLLSHRFNNILDFNPKTGVVFCESGVSLAEIFDHFLSRGWFLRVTPGTKWVSVGGAIASDLHGKNHHNAGCFSEYLLSLDLMLPTGDIVHCNREENRELFLATCGGMGLTGVILAGTFRLQRVRSAYIREKIIPAKNLEEIFALFEENQTATYAVAWIDCLADGRHRGRSLLMLGEHADDGRFDRPTTRTLAIPVDLPAFFLNRYSVSLFNELYYRRAFMRAKERIVHIDKFFYPLDSILQWNRMYGRRGFTQYQLVLPKESSFEGLRDILATIAKAGLGSFLAVLKLLGPENNNYLSFPMEGYTLALDFRIQERLFPLLDELDHIVVGHRGRLYLAKDVRMSPEMFMQSYPRWKSFVEVREKLGLRAKFNSLQSRRLGI